MSTLTSRDRVSRMLDGLDHDRVPPTHLGWECTDVDVWRSCIRPRMERHGLFIDVLDRYGEYC